MRKFADKIAPPNVRSLWVSDQFTGKGTYDDPLSVTGVEGGESSGNVDGGNPGSVYGGSIVIDGGGP